MKTLLRIFICSLVICVNTIYGAIQQDKQIQKKDDHTTEILQSVQKYLHTSPISPSINPLLNGTMCRISLVDSPCFLSKENGARLSSAILSIVQNDVEFYSEFLIKEKTAPYQAEVSLVYTCDALYCTPTYILFCDVLNNLPVLKKQPPKNYRVHISKTQHNKNGNYIQEWNFYTEKESLKQEIAFIPDGRGGSYIIFLEDHNKYQKNLILEKGLKGVMATGSK